MIENSIVKSYGVIIRSRFENPIVSSSRLLTHGYLIFFSDFSRSYPINIHNRSIILLNHIMNFFIVRKKVKYLLVLFKQCMTIQIQWLLYVNVSAQGVYLNLDFLRPHIVHDHIVSMK